MMNSVASQPHASPFAGRVVAVGVALVCALALAGLAATAPGLAARRAPKSETVAAPTQAPTGTAVTELEFAPELITVKLAHR